MSLISIIHTKVIPFVFKISEQPMLFKELMHANKIYNDGMNLEYNMKGFRIRLGRIYFVYFALVLFLATPLSFIFHTQLAKIDCHALIISSIVFTILLFSGFALFKSWLVEQVSVQLITKAWKNHFPHFAYANNTQKVSNIYAEALEIGIQNKDLQRHIITKMVD
ncbi:hypothetical protein JHD50_08010 [Sulfurimonas sp. MAG313]|nr:hypothetical protein [Sulfurimonas sp. MAG313]MDF1881245.1 hypothetical protein [Sulfurimonas sp. MAG313]